MCLRKNAAFIFAETQIERVPKNSTSVYFILFQPSNGINHIKSIPTIPSTSCSWPSSCALDGDLSVEPRGCDEPCLNNAHLEYMQGITASAMIPTR